MYPTQLLYIYIYQIYIYSFIKVLWSHSLSHCYSKYTDVQLGASRLPGIYIYDI